MILICLVLFLKSQLGKYSMHMFTFSLTLRRFFFCPFPTPPSVKESCFCTLEAYGLPPGGPAGFALQQGMKPTLPSSVRGRVLRCCGLPPGSCYSLAASAPSMADVVAHVETLTAFRLLWSCSEAWLREARWQGEATEYRPVCFSTKICA